MNHQNPPFENETISLVYVMGTEALSQNQLENRRWSNMVDQSLTILVLLHASSDAWHVESLLAASDAVVYETQLVDSLINILEDRDQQRYDVILLDLTLVDEPGFEPLHTLFQTIPACPVIILASAMQEHRAIQAVGQEAHAYVITEYVSTPGLIHTMHQSLQQYHHAQDLIRSQHNMDAWENNFRSIVRNNADGIIVVNTQGQIKFVNQAAEKLFDRPSHKLLDAVFGFPVVAGETTELHILRSTGQTAVVEMRVVDAAWKGERMHLASLRDITERKRSEIRLRAERDFTNTILNIATALIVVFDPEGHIIRFNRACEQTTGYEAREIEGQIFWNRLLPPEEIEDAQAVFARLHTGEYPIRHESHWRSKDGDYRLIDWSSTANVASDGQLEYILSIGIDITDRRQAEKAEERQRAFADALRNCSAALLNSTLDLEQVLRRVLAHVGLVIPYQAGAILLQENGSAYTVYSNGFEQFGIADWVQVANFKIDHYPFWQQMETTQQAIVIRDTRQMADWVSHPLLNWVRSEIGTPITLNNKVIGYFLLFSSTPNYFNDTQAKQLQAFADQTAIAIQNAQLYAKVLAHSENLERLIAQRTQTLEQERAQFKAILDAMGEGVAFIDLNNQIQYTNRAFLEILGYSAEETHNDPDAIYQMMTSPMSDIQTWSEDVSRIIAQGKTWRSKIRLQRKDGLQFDVAVTITAVTLPDEQPIGRVELIRDISKEKALQEQKDRFIANASHELRTPLANIKIRHYLIRRQPERMLEHLDVLDRVIERIESLVEDLLDMSRFERGVIPLHFRPVELQGIIHHVVTVQRPHIEQKLIALNVQLPDEPLIIDADVYRLTQVFTNVLNNAINYTPEEGTISVQTEVVTSGDGSISVTTVKDSGIGISAQILPRIFDPFFRATEGGSKGTGLGLAVAREIIDRHGGEINVESDEDTGSMFTITLPLK